MKTLARAAVLVAVVGCGGQAIEGSQIAGNWISPSGSACGAYLELSDARFARGTICVVNGVAEAQGQTGAYSLTGDMLTLTADHASCAGDTTFSGVVSFTDTGLMDVTDGATAEIVAYQPNAASALSASPAFGCLGPNEAFMPAPLAAL
jgi:hypothetical protein